LNDEVRDILARLVAQYGQELCTDRQRVEGLLRDLCGQHRREIGVLVSAVREGVAQELRGAPGTEVDALVFHRLVQKLDHNAGIAEDYARWALTTWAEALGRQAPAEPMGGRGSPRAGSASQVGEERINPVDGTVMVYIPAGEFLMGSADGDALAEPNEKPQRRVYLDAYWIHKYLVTVGQYRRFCRSTRREMPYNVRLAWQQDQPMTDIYWDDATLYADWAGVVLPTEAQWEKAARGTDGRTYPWGNVWDPSKCSNCVGHTLPTGPRGLGPLIKVGEPPEGPMPTEVGRCPEGASPYGALDMAGNVGEWCADWYDEDYYINAPHRDPPGPHFRNRRVVRGGSHINAFHFPTRFRCAERCYAPSDSKHDFIGFRCALSRPDSG